MADAVVADMSAPPSVRTSSIAVWQERRYSVLVACLILSVGAGTSYAFGVYSPDLKSELHYSQNQLESVSTLGNIGLYVSVSCGLVFDNYGPRWTILYGSALQLLGYMLMWAGSNQWDKISHAPWAMGLYSLLWSNGASAFDMAAVGSTVRNFQDADTGTAVGLVKANFGLSASIVTALYQAWFQGDVHSFLLFLGIFMAGLGALMLPVIRIMPAVDLGGGASGVPLVGRKGQVRLRVAYCLVLALAVLLAVTSILKQQRPSVAAVVIVLMVSPVLILIPAKLWTDHEAESIHRTPLLRPEEPELRDVANVEPRAGAFEHNGGNTLKDAMLSLDFYLLFVVTFVWTGAALLVINNIGQIVQSLGGKQDDQDVEVTVLSVANCCGRLFAGFLSDRLRHVASRPLFLVLFLLLMVAGLLIMAFSHLSLLNLGCVIVGLGYGSYWSLNISVLKERYGNANFGTISTVVALSPAVASEVLAKTMASDLYDDKVVPGTHDCYGLSLLLSAGMCALGALLSLVLWYRLRPLYQVRLKTVDPVMAAAAAAALTTGASTEVAV